MAEISEIAVSYPGEGYDSEPTFTGVLRKYFVHRDEFGNNLGISKRWNDDTKAAFIQDYNQRLIPALVDLFGEEKPLHSFTEDEFEQTLEYLNDQHHYADNTLLHYRHLLWVVYRAGFEHGLYADNIFWDDVYDPMNGSAESRESLRANVMTRIRKSFSIDEELRIVQWFQSLSPETVSGEDLGLLLMFFEGLRNNEACGANFSSIHSLKSHSDVHVFDMLQSTVIDSNEVKSGGKTSNAPRVLPLFEPFYAFLMKRRKFLSDKITSGELVLPPEIKSVDHLPVVCVKDNYTVRASTKKLTMAGRKLFEQIGIEKSELAFLHQILFSQEFKAAQIDEKEPTTYLFRRNCATHLYQMGFTAAEIQYWMGHDIEDPFLSRNAFSDEDTIYNLAMMAQSHPLHMFFASAPPTPMPILPELFFRQLSSSAGYAINTNGISTQFLIDLTACEPQQPISVSIENPGGYFDVTVDVATSTQDYPRTADIRNQQQSAYKKRITALKNT